jgi:hypothetical protein
VGDALIHISSRHFHKTASVVIHLPSPSCVLQRPAQIIDFSVKELTKKKTEKNQWHLQIHPSQSQRCHHEADR